MTMHADLSADSPDDRGKTMSSGRIIARASAGAVHEQTLIEGGTLIGRDPACDIVITNGRVSRHHALIVSTPKTTTLVDLASTNGTLVHGQRIQRCTLHDGDVVTIGDCRIEYVAGAERQNGHRDSDGYGKLRVQSLDPAVTLADREQQSLG